MKIGIWFVAGLSMTLAATAAEAAPPNLQTPNPVIYLADNLDEKDQLGWCIDTVGRGLSDRLHAHSCKPQGGDVQFTYNKSSRQIMSATYSGKCARLSAAPSAGVSLGLVDCNASAAQLFDFDGGKSTFHPGADRSLCLAVGAASRSAGPFMSRDLTLAACGSTEAEFKVWRIKEGGT